MKRKTYQFGWLETKIKVDGSQVWVYRYREPQLRGTFRKRSIEIGSKKDYPTKSLAWNRAEHLRLGANPDNASAQLVTFGALVDRYLAEELPELRHSTGQTYRSYIENHVRPKWAEYPIAKVRPFPVELWLKSLTLAPKSKGHIHNLMRVLFNSAMRWELIEIGQNPMKLVRVRGVSKRGKEPRVLSITECHQLLAGILDEPFRTMVILDMATGLRCSELLALKWCDVDWQSLALLVRRSYVDGVVDQVKTKYSEAGLPLDTAVADILWNWKAKTEFSSQEDWVFASPSKAGELPYHPWGVQFRRIRPAAIQAGLGKGIGWHTFRHTFSSMLRSNGEDLKVQQELLRHADIRTTLNVYTQAMTEHKRQAHSKIVRMVLPTSPKSGNQRAFAP